MLGKTFKFTKTSNGTVLLQDTLDDSVITSFDPSMSLYRENGNDTRFFITATTEEEGFLIDYRYIDCSLCFPVIRQTNINEFLIALGRDFFFLNKKTSLGEKGDTGAAGENGRPGKDGSPGEQGKMGPIGPMGPPGKDGASGVGVFVPQIVIETQVDIDLNKTDLNGLSQKGRNVVLSTHFVGEQGIKILLTRDAPIDFHATYLLGLGSFSFVPDVDVELIGFNGKIPTAFSLGTCPGARATLSRFGNVYYIAGSPLRYCIGQGQEQ